MSADRRIGQHFEYESRMLMASGWGKWMSDDVRFTTAEDAESFVKAMQERIRRPAEWEFRIVRVAREVVGTVEPLKVNS